MRLAIVSSRSPRFRACSPIVASRSINSLIWALLLVSILGPGLLAGILAIAFRSIGFVGKLLYEAIEETDASQIEAVEATGAGRAQVLTYGYWPQVAPAFWGISVFRWDINIRESAVLGLVGSYLGIYFYLRVIQLMFMSADGATAGPRVGATPRGTREGRAAHRAPR